MSVNDEHLRLLEDQLRRLKPGSKAYNKVFSEHKRLTDELKMKSNYKAPFKQRWTANAKDGATKARKTFHDYGTNFNHAKTAVKFNQAASWTAMIGGTVTSGHGRGKEAGTKVDKQVGAQSNKNRRKIRVGDAVAYGGLGTYLGNAVHVGMIQGQARNVIRDPENVEKAAKLTKMMQPGRIHATAFGAGVVAAGAGYALSRHQNPNNSATSKQWIVYTRRSPGGPIQRVKRKNPNFGKKRAKR